MMARLRHIPKDWIVFEPLGESLDFVNGEHTLVTNGRGTLTISTADCDTHLEHPVMKLRRLTEAQMANCGTPVDSPWCLRATITVASTPPKLYEAFHYTFDHPNVSPVAGMGVDITDRHGVTVVYVTWNAQHRHWILRCEEVDYAEDGFATLRKTLLDNGWFVYDQEEARKAGLLDDCR